MQEYERVKFIFTVLEKFIVMDLNSKIALDDLKFTFTNILKIDLFAKRLQFSITKGLKQYSLNSQQSLIQQENLRIFNLNNQERKQIDINVKFIEEGA
ncbi:unnamed protein product [Paramecium primaurelia]|uniref:Uncharacterized protein n=2 Tax=Paramecium TaxID=5884 RepID=A0A8S1QP33_PARPR|nr:unnamed protein product [Paramecium primaurelia]CAD8117563.1 unnamed protein product [Paramecium primaurelia]CAD8196484.1 unnamed protein product [Paramecium pentaurelia]